MTSIRVLLIGNLNKLAVRPTNLRNKNSLTIQTGLETFSVLAIVFITSLNLQSFETMKANHASLFANRPAIR